MLKALVFAITFLFAVSAFGQDMEIKYGDPSDLKGLTKVYIYAGTNLNDYNRFTKHLSEVDEIEIVSNKDEAEIIINFEGGNVRERTGGVFGEKKKRTIGEGFVGIPDRESNSMTIVMNFESTRDKFLEDKPATKFAKKFRKAWKQANE